MRPERGDAAFLWDMFESAQSALNMVKGMDFAAYSADHRTRRAVEREIEIIGAAARRVSDGFKKSYILTCRGKKSSVSAIGSPTTTRISKMS